jgi:hypothetical protein
MYRENGAYLERQRKWFGLYSTTAFASSPFPEWLQLHPPLAGGPSPPERIWFGIGIGIGIGLVHGSAQGSMIPRYQAPYVQLPPVSRSFYATVSTLL